MSSGPTSPVVADDACADRVGAHAATVLVVDDEPMVVEVVTEYLRRDGHRVVASFDGDDAVLAIERERPDLIVLDIMLPNRDGLTLLQELRRHSDVPVILLSARTDEVDRVLGLELGAHDYVVKPFSPRELSIRVQRQLRPRTEADDVIRHGSLEIDRRSRRVTHDAVEVLLTAREFDVLVFLAAAPRRVFSKAQMLEHVWGSSEEWQDPATVTVHVGRIRQKLTAAGVDADHLHTVRGAGYRFEP
jgi:DNA-binding response OmpR family regulator